MDTNYKKFYDLNVVELVKRFMKQWYILVAVGLLMSALAVLAGKYCRHHVSNENTLDPMLMSEISTDEEADQIREMLSEDDIKEIDICMDRIDVINSSKKYMNEAVLMQVDPYSCRILTVEYEFSSEQVGTARNIEAKYISFVTGDEVFQHAVEQAIGDKDGRYHISDVVSAKEVSAIQDSVGIVRLDINIVLLDDWDEEAVISAVRDTVESLKLIGSDNDVAVDLAFSKSSVITKWSEDIQKLQSKVVEQYNKDISNYTTAANRLNRPALLLFNYELKELGMENDYGIELATVESTDTEETDRGVMDDIAEKSYSKLALLGFAGGVIVVCGMMLCYWYIKGKAGRLLGISLVPDRNLFGMIRKKGKKEEIADDLEIVANNLSSFLYKIGENSVDLLCIGQPGEKYEKMIKKLSSQLNARDELKGQVHFFLLQAPYNYDILADIGKNVVFCIAYEENSIKDIYMLEQQLSSVNIRVLGSIGIE